jgi:hypothetical protein
MSPTASVSRTSAVDPQSLVLPEGEWLFDESHRLTDFTPGTWCRRQDWMDRRIGAAVCCPVCHMVCMLIAGVHEVDHEGLVKPDFMHRHADGGPCTFHRRLVLDRWLKKPLWCVIIGRARTGAPETTYVNAMTRAEALFHAAIRAPDVLIECGLAIGNFAQDGTGKSGVAVTDLSSVRMPTKPIRSFGGVGGGK